MPVFLAIKIDRPTLAGVTVAAAKVESNLRLFCDVAERGQERQMASNQTNELIGELGQSTALETGNSAI